jgi:hypothetical protein
MRAVSPFLLVPFLLGNLSGKDRTSMSREIPWLVTRVLVPVWRNKWAPMEPFLL